MKLRAIAVALALLSSSGAAWAERAVALDFRRCSAFDTDEVRRLVEVELITVGGGESNVGSAEVRVDCGQEAVDVVAREPGSTRSLSRSLEGLADAEAAERLLAIAIAQLVRALDWVPEAAAAPAPTREPERTRSRPPTRVAARQLELQLVAGPRARQLEQALLGYRVALRSSFDVVPRLRFGGGVSYERGSSARRLGRIDSQLLGAGLQAGLEPWRGRFWSGLLQLELAAQHASLRGRPSSGAALAGDARGFGAEAQLSAGPVLRYGSVGVALLAESGIAYFGGEGRVTDERAVQLSGAWLGAGLALLWRP